MKCPQCNGLTSSFDSECEHCGAKLIHNEKINIAEIKHKVATFTEKKCPNCGAPLKSSTCAFCGSEFVGVAKEDEAGSAIIGRFNANGCNGTCMSTCTGCTGSCSGNCASTSAGMSGG